MTIKTVTVYIGQWNDREFVFSLDYDSAKTLVEGHFAFGDPSEDEYALGNIWALKNQDDGWRIVQTRVEATLIHVELKTSQGDDTPHVVWQCPYCEQFCSDDWQPNDVQPILLRCGCEEASKFLLGMTSNATV